MGKPYANDLRAAAIRLIEEGRSRPEVAELCGISLSSVGRWIHRYRTTGSIRPAKFGGYKQYALAEHSWRIQRWIARQPDLTLLEIQARLSQAGIKVAASSVFRFLRHLGLSFKKKALRAAEQDRPDVAAKRRRWRRGQRKLDPKRLVFLDETALCSGMTRRGGRGPRGSRVVCKVPFQAWQTITMVLGLRHDRIIAPMLLQGAMTGEAFRTYIARVLAPELHRGDLVVMDNVPLHRTGGVREALAKLGVSIADFPAYSPDLTAIEQPIGKLKAFLCKLGPRSLRGLLAGVRRGLEQFSPAQCAAYLRQAGYAST
jgi:transposase